MNVRSARVDAQKHKSTAGDGRFALVITLVYFAILLTAVLHHEMWRDEIEIWMIGKGMHSLPQFIRLIDAEPNPAIWYAFVTVVAKLFAGPVGMQISGVLISTLATYILLRFAPLPRLYKVLFIFGFFPFFEYQVINRPYTLGLLFTFIFCAMFRYRRKNLLAMSGILFLMANTSACNMVLAFALGLTLVAAWYFDRKSGVGWLISKKKALLAGIIFVLGIVFSVIQTSSPLAIGSLSVSGNSYSLGGVVRALSLISYTYLYNFGVLKSVYFYPFASLVLVMLVALPLRDRPVALLAYLLMTGSMALVVYVHQLAFLWHIAHIYIAFFVALWIAGYYPHSRANTKNQLVLNKVLDYTTLFILIFQLFPCAYAVYADYAAPYSCAKQVAEYIKSHDMQDMVITGDIDYKLSTVSGYLEKPVNYMAQGENGIYYWFGDVQPFPFSNMTSADDFCRRLRLLTNKDDVLLVLSYPLPESIQNRVGAEFLTSMEESISGYIQNEPACYENYWLYKVKRTQKACSGE